MRAPRMRVKDDERGTALIEFALILPFMLVITLTVVDLSRAFYFKSMLGQAARDGAREAAKLVAPGAGADADTVISRTKRVLFPVTNSSWGLTNLSVTITEPAVGYFQVQASGQFNWLYLGALNHLAPAGFSNPQTLVGAHAMKHEVQAS